jgi:cell division septal protein FtsQ
LIACICLVALLRITVREAFLKNPQFELRQIVVRTEGPLSVQKIVRTTGLTEGTNLLTINMRELRAKLERLPQVKKASLERDYAGRLCIDVQQRAPVAWIECAKLGFTARKAGAAHLLDADAVIFPCEDVTGAYETLPVVRFEQLSQGIYGTPVPDFQIKVALKLLAELQQRFEQGPDEPRLIDIQTPYSIVTTFADKTEVTFGVDDLDLQLTRLDRVRHEVRQRQWEVATLNLLVRQNVPITFRRAPELIGLQDVPRAVPVPESKFSRTAR